MFECLCECEIEKVNIKNHLGYIYIYKNTDESISIWRHVSEGLSEF